MPSRPKYSLDAKRNLAAAMRAKPTNAEAALWDLLRANQIGARFRRQITIKGWIVDFYCPTLRLAIEVDGSAHNNEVAQARDKLKETVLTGAGIKVLHFENEDVLKAPSVVWFRIKAECEAQGLVKGLVRGVAAVDSPTHSSNSSRPNNQPETCVKRPTSNHSNGFPTKNGAQNLCTTTKDVVEIPGDHRITPAEYETFHRKLVTLSRQRSMTFGLPPDNRSSAEKAADLKYRLAEHLERRRRQA